jgi:hypothetical protein
MALVKKLKVRSCQDLALRDGYFRAPREGLSGHNSGIRIIDCELLRSKFGQEKGLD